MAPTHLYVKPVLALMQSIAIKGMAHITGGGLTENVPRVLPPGARPCCRNPPGSARKLFDWLQREGGVAEGGDAPRLQLRHRHGADRGAGASPPRAGTAQRSRRKAVEIGTIEWRDGDEAQTIVV